MKYKTDNLVRDLMLAIPCEHCKKQNLLRVVEKPEGLYLVGHGIDFPIAESCQDGQ